MVIDAGGRGAALVHAYSKSKLVSKILAIPGNDLMQINSKKKVIIFPNLKSTSVDEIVNIAKKYKVDLVDVAQDNAVAAGVTNALQEAEILTIGPTKEAGQIEWDKSWSRDFMKKYNLPHPKYFVFDSEKQGIEFLKKQPQKKWFIKASGLCEGKGVLPAESTNEAFEKIQEMEKFGKAGEKYLLEEWLEGEEFSSFALCNGKRFLMLGNAQDHKRMYTGDVGENTGGMGCSTPPLVLTPQILKTVRKIFQKTLIGLTKEKRPYNGILYLGGILIKNGNKIKPYIIEFNARWGSPEAEVLVPGITSDFFKINFLAAQKQMQKIKVKIDKKSRVAVALALRKGAEVKKRAIYGIQKAKNVPGVTIYGTRILVENKKYFAINGRLLFIVAVGKNIMEAREKAYKAASLIYLQDNSLHYRTDIGWRDIERISKNSKS